MSAKLENTKLEQIWFVHTINLRYIIYTIENSTFCSENCLKTTNAYKRADFFKDCKDQYFVVYVLPHI